ncbi:MAG: hypothetical protein IT391_13825 [Nitrospira sp.]|nr:hypothetical protein [Nitrospira sp.]
MPVTLINVFSAPIAKDEDFVKWWADIKYPITKQPGFISGTFHKNIKSDSRFNHINVAIWDNETLYWKATRRVSRP